MALGAGAREVLVLREAAALTAAGMLLGRAVSLVAARWLGALVYGLSARDPLSYGLALLLLPSAALLGCWRPASRASAADPPKIIIEE